MDLVYLKAFNPELKVMMTIYSKYWDKAHFSTATITTFVNLALTFCRDMGFDGINLDWAYPYHDAGDYETFTLILQVRCKYYNDVSNLNLLLHVHILF